MAGDGGQACRSASGVWVRTRRVRENETGAWGQTSRESMGAEEKGSMRQDWQTWVKKLALAYETGWEYQPGSEEPGSVLTDLFLEMEEKNEQRMEKVGGKHRQAFLKAVPERGKERKKLRAFLSVKAPATCDGKRLEKGTRVYTVTEDGVLADFQTASSLLLTAARLRWVICRRGLSAWLCYEDGDGFPILTSGAQRRELAHPVFRWRFRGMCDGHKTFSFAVDFGEDAEADAAPPGSWTISDGGHAYPAAWTQAEGKRLLSGECPAFAGNLEGGDYELRMEMPAEEALTEAWRRALAGELVLKEEEETLEPERCLTEAGPGSSRRTLPFGREPEPAACFYLAFDRAAAGARRSLVLRFSEGYETEERLPEPEPEVPDKRYRKYAWMFRAEPVQEWKAEETVWEYFNGSMWHVLPGSEDWRTGCRAEDQGERSLAFTLPEDAQPCVVEGEEHFYLRLRVEKVQGAYAAYFRKRIPVLHDIRMCASARSFRPRETDLPDFSEWFDGSLYLGFDREVTCDNRWYTGKGCRSFTPVQVKGRSLRYGMEAYWVELPWGGTQCREERSIPSGGPSREGDQWEGDQIEALLPNVVEICQETADDVRQRIPERSAYYVEVGGLGVLDAVSLSEAHYDENGAPIRSETDAAEHFFQHFGRLLTPMDLELLLQERYPLLHVKSCAYGREDNELDVTLVLPQQEGREREEERLSEISGWLRGALQRMGGLWMQDVGVRCTILWEDGTGNNGNVQGNGQGNGDGGEKASGDRNERKDGSRDGNPGGHQDGGTEQLSCGTEQLSGGTERLSGGTEQLSGGTIKLDDSSYDKIWERVMEGLDSRAPWWSHRETSDPGITLLEMWAVLCDMQSFYLDQIQESHYRKYLKLLGIAPDEGSCAETLVSFQDVEEDCTLPAGTRLLADTMVFETEGEAPLIANSICGLIREGSSKQVAGMLRERKNRMVLKKSEILFSVLLTKPLRAGQEFLLYVLLDETAGRNPMPRDFSLVTLAWEYRTAQGWREAQTLRDDTHGLLCSGCIRLRAESDMAAHKGSHVMRCRVVEGEYDAMPVLYKVSLNVVGALQKKTLCSHEDAEFPESCGRMELKGYLARTGSVRVFAAQGNGQWRDVTAKCHVDPPITAQRRERYVHFEGTGKVRILCFSEEFTEELGSCPLTGVTGQKVEVPFPGLLRSSVELMLAQDREGRYREYRCVEPEETWVDNAWHWQEGEDCIALGDGRHGSIPPAAEDGVLFASLSLFEGKKGNVAIGRIRRLEREDLFPKMTCSNPMPGCNGRDRMLPSEQFEGAGGSLREPRRIVTREDAEELAKRTPGLLIEKAEAQWRDQAIVVTVTPKAFIKDAPLVQRYREAVEDYLEPYRPAGIRIRVEVAEQERGLWQRAETAE